jgi:hypothetical protein
MTKMKNMTFKLSIWTFISFMKMSTASEKIIRESPKNLEDIQEVGKNYYKVLTFQNKRFYKIEFKMRNKWKMTSKTHKNIASNIFIRSNRI